MTGRWFECPYDTKLRAVHKLVHEQRISEDDLNTIMAVLGYDIGTLLIYDPGKGPAAIMLLA